MVRYRRNVLPRGTFFFTVALADRRSLILVDPIDALRGAVREARHRRITVANILSGRNVTGNTPSATRTTSCAHRIYSLQPSKTRARPSPRISRAAVTNYRAI
jgi:hypothetical protein